MQDMLNQAESLVVGLKKQVPTEKELREKAKKLSSDFEESLISCTDKLEKAKTSFADEKAALLKHAEEAESKLEPITQELQTLKSHIQQMCIAIFGK
jgi:hypothetical protein